eukprot:CAMPEP_0119101642 /NCGR_PEP_ID=MMETSP1180-20130426/639_1 /TAXON_ID=3052 ORGANISM="Chlamydomonas cf sp, Strain CCMP681" /NCGR_SAMPLE_ID=MMETSP1180 /ASSEMBLY_ACC=CAM_ASM_000741 /LENGTH=110 /DNA_ID=CAMNT_0007085793 /DNA_START=678 /DNA_END=1010 /DNA_ORIENTATION=-
MTASFTGGTVVSVTFAFLGTGRSSIDLYLLGMMKLMVVCLSLVCMVTGAVIATLLVLEVVMVTGAVIATFWLSAPSPRAVLPPKMYPATALKPGPMFLSIGPSRVTLARI